MKPSSHREMHAGMVHFSRQAQSDSYMETGASLGDSSLELPRVMVRDCVGLTRYEPHRLACLNAWLRVSVIWRCGLVVGVALLEEVSHSGGGL